MQAVFAALEAEVAGKMSELEALEVEHSTLKQRVEILEVRGLALNQSRKEAVALSEECELWYVTIGSRAGLGSVAASEGDRERER